MRLIDQIHLDEPFLGTRCIRDARWDKGIKIGRSHVRALMGKMGIEALYQKPRLSGPPSGTYDLSLPATGNVDHQRQCRLVHRYHLHPRGQRLLLPRSGHGLGKQEGVVLASIEYPGYLNQGSQFTSDDVTQALKDHAIKIKYGWTGPADGQHLYRMTLEKREVSGYLPQSLRLNEGVERRTEELVWSL
jgi:hypothetical protein